MFSTVQLSTTVLSTPLLRKMLSARPPCCRRHGRGCPWKRSFEGDRYIDVSTHSADAADLAIAFDDAVGDLHSIEFRSAVTAGICTSADQQVADGVAVSVDGQIVDRIDGPPEAGARIDVLGDLRGVAGVIHLLIGDFVFEESRLFGGGDGGDLVFGVNRGRIAVGLPAVPLELIRSVDEGGEGGAAW